MAVQVQTAAAIVDAAGATVIRAHGSTIIVLAHDAPSADELIPVRAAAAEARCSVRALTAARRAGELAMYGTQRTRTVRRSDLAAWIGSRRVRPVAGVDDADMRRRMRNLEGSRRTA